MFCEIKEMVIVQVRGITSQNEFPDEFKQEKGLTDSTNK